MPSSSPYDDFSTCVAEFESRADEDGAHDGRDDAIEHRDAHITGVGGTLDITANGGDGLTAAEMIAIHREFVEREFRTDAEARRAEFGDAAEAHSLPRTARQRRFDALVAIFRTAAGAEGLGATTDPLVNVVIDERRWARILAAAGLAPTESLDGEPIDPFTGVARPADLLDDLLAAGEDLTELRCETTNGVRLHPHDVLRAALAGHIRRVVVDSAGVAVDMGRRRRLFEGPAREAAMLLIRRCEHPGCDLPADFCDVDHAEEWADGGSTDQENSRIRCGRHNVAKSKRRWRSKRATNGRTYTVRDDGTIMLPVGVRPPTLYPDEEDPAEVARLTKLIRARAAALRAA